jgi:hypothetical protein
VLSSYRRMLQLRGASLALSAGSLEILDPPANPNKVFAYHRVHEDADRRETADVFLNFSKREVPIDLRRLSLSSEARPYSNLSDAPIAARGRHVLRPWEG